MSPAVPMRALQAALDYEVVMGAAAVAAEFASAFATATWQATCLAPMGVGRGVSCEHVSIAYGQRQRKRQPSLGLMTFGGSPVSPEIDSAPSPSPGGDSFPDPADTAQSCTRPDLRDPDAARGPGAVQEGAPVAAVAAESAR